MFPSMGKGSSRCCGHFGREKKMKWALCLFVLVCSFISACAPHSTQADMFMMPPAKQDSVYLCVFSSFGWDEETSNVKLISSCYTDGNYDDSRPLKMSITLEPEAGEDRCFLVPTKDERRRIHICARPKAEPPRMILRVETLVEYGMVAMGEDLCLTQDEALTADYEVTQHFDFCQGSRVLKNL